MFCRRFTYCTLPAMHVTPYYTVYYTPRPSCTCTHLACMHPLHALPRRAPPCSCHESPCTSLYTAPCACLHRLPPPCTPTHLLCMHPPCTVPAMHTHTPPGTSMYLHSIHPHAAAMHRPCSSMHHRAPPCTSVHPHAPYIALRTCIYYTPLCRTSLHLYTCLTSLDASPYIYSCTSRIESCLDRSAYTCNTSFVHIPIRHEHMHV